MRIAPIPLYAVVDGRMDILDADSLSGDAAEITVKRTVRHQTLVASTGAHGGIRTRDLLVNSQLLCLLSYMDYCCCGKGGAIVHTKQSRLCR